MSYHFLHAGLPIGESDLDHPGQRRNQLAGIFRPNGYGLQLLPQMTGILSAGLELKSHLDERGLDPEAIAIPQVGELFEKNAGGRKIIAIARLLCDIEVRDASGGSLPFDSLAFSDMHELRDLVRKLHPGPDAELPELLPDAPRYLVSLTFTGSAKRRSRARGASRSRGRPSPPRPIEASVPWPTSPFAPSPPREES